MAQDGLARAIYPVHTAARRRHRVRGRDRKRPLADPVYAFAELGALAANVLARAVARAVYEATALPFPARCRAGRTNWLGAESGQMVSRKYMNRSARYGDGSVNGARRSSSRRRSCPVTGRQRQPLQWPWPNASHSPFWPGAPAEHGQRVRHVRAAAEPRLGLVRLAHREQFPGVAAAPCRSAWRWRASRLANSAPVVSRMPCSIGVSA